MLKRIVKLPKKHSFFLFGPRQVGKSTLLEHEFSPEKTLYYDLLDPATYSRLLEDPSILKQEILVRDPQITYIVIDEIQKIPVLLDIVHLIIESKESVIFCLTGSSARKLKRSGVNLLAGRAWTLSLFPLSHKELEQKGSSFDLDKALNYGTLPSVYLDPEEDNAKRTLRSYVDTYLNEEIKLESLVRNLSGFVNFLRFAANENGNILNYSNIARESALDSKTVKEYFQILEDTLIGFFLPSYSKSHRDRMVKHPKFYFFDTGVQRALCKKLNLSLQRKTYDYGNVFEHFMIKEIMNLSKYAENDYEFSFYRTKSGGEVDLIISCPQGRVYALEFKAKDIVVGKDLRGLRSFQEICPGAQLICVNLSPRAREIEGVMIYPWNEVFKVIGL